MLIHAALLAKRGDNQLPTGVGQLLGLVGSVVGMELGFLPGLR